jgi:hypothetical protein
MTNLEGIIQQLTEERNRIDAAIKTLSSVNGRSANGTFVSQRKPRGRMSAAARARIAAAQRARWAKSKGKETEAPKRRVLSPAARRRIIAAQKRRWAKVRAAKKA